MTLQIKILHPTFIIKTFMSQHTLGFSTGYNPITTRKNIFVTEICSEDRNLGRDSNCLNVCSIFNTMSRHREIIVTTQFFDQLETRPVKCRYIEKNVVTLSSVIQFEVVSQHSNFVS